MKYGDASGTIHKTNLLNVELDSNGMVVSVWFRCMALPFDQRIVDLNRAQDMRRMYEGYSNKLVNVEVETPLEKTEPLSEKLGGIGSIDDETQQPLLQIKSDKKSTYCEHLPTAKDGKALAIMGDRTSMVVCQACWDGVKLAGGQVHEIQSWLWGFPVVVVDPDKPTPSDKPKVETSVTGDVVEHHYRCFRDHEFSIMLKGKQELQYQVICPIVWCHRTAHCLGENPAEVAKNPVDLLEH